MSTFPPPPHLGSQWPSGPATRDDIDAMRVENMSRFYDLLDETAFDAETPDVARIVTDHALARLLGYA